MKSDGMTLLCLIIKNNFCLLQNSLRVEASHHLDAQQPSVRVSSLSSPFEDEGEVVQARVLTHQQRQLQLSELPHEVCVQELDEETLAQRTMRSSEEDQREGQVQQVGVPEGGRQSENGFQRFLFGEQATADDD